MRLMDRKLVSAAASQARDLVANDNRSDAQRLRDARALQRWAADRSEWSELALLAAAEAQRELRALRLRSV